jgi:hypothetical protein
LTSGLPITLLPCTKVLAYSLMLLVSERLFDSGILNAYALLFFHVYCSMMYKRTVFGVKIHGHHSVKSPSRDWLLATEQLGPKNR